MRPRRRSAGSELRVLVVRRDGVGDFILTTPFLRELRRNLPNAQITLLVGANVSDLAVMCPYVDAVDTVPLRNLKLGELLDLVKFARARLRGRFDLAVIPRWDVDLYWSTLIACLSGAPRIIAYTRKTSALKATMNWGYDRLVKECLPQGREVHEIDRSLAIIKHLGGAAKSRSMELWSSAADQEEADRFLATAGAGDWPRPWIGFGIGASLGRKRWPYFDELLMLMAQRMSFSALLFASPDELEVANLLSERIPDCFVVCQPLRVAAVIMSRCDLFVGNDSGPLHIAAAARLPSVEISCHPRDGDPSHEYSPLRFGHLGVHSRAVQPLSGLDNCSDSCREVFPHCIAQVTPGQVIGVINSLLVTSVRSNEAHRATAS